MSSDVSGRTRHDRWGALATYLSASPDWQQVYQDNLAVIFVRKKGR